MPFVNPPDIKAPDIKAPAFRRIPGLAFAVLALGLAGCSSAAYDEAADQTDPAEGMAFGDLVPEDDGSVLDDAVSAETSTFDPPEPERVPLTPEEIAEFEMPPVPNPDELPLAIDEERSEAVIAAAASEDLEILAAAAIDPTPTKEEIEAWGDGLPRTENGRLISLDEPASVACANVEMTIRAIDDGDSETASDRLARAVSLVNESTSDGVQSWLPLLEAQSGAEAIDPLVVVGFLEACAAAGHDL